MATTAAAQGVTVRGVVFDSLHSRPLAGAFVAIGAKSSTSDAAGRFTIADVAPGSYRVMAQHDVVDQLGISAIGSQVRVTDGNDLVTVALPSFRTLWRQVCGLTPPVADTGFVFGTVRAGRSATVSATWIDVTVTGTKISQKLKIMEASADSLGNFALCGVPTTTGLTLRAVADSMDSGSFDIPPMDQERVVRRDLALLSSATVTPASLTGKVIADSGGGPLAKTEVSITDLDLKTTTDEQGTFTFKAVPPGSHRIYVRRIGYGELDVIQEFQSGEQVHRDIVLPRITMLDSVSVTASALARDELLRGFEEHRKLGLGKFLTADDLSKANGRSLPQMMVMFPQLTIKLQRDGRYVPSFIGRGPKSLIPTSGGCQMAVYINGVLDRLPDLNAFPVDQIAGVEYFRGAAQTPPEYAGLGSGCGVIVIHLKKK
jgi:hypothetical protein